MELQTKLLQGKIPHLIFELKNELFGRIHQLD